MKVYRISDQITMITGVYGLDMTSKSLGQIRSVIRGDWQEYKINRSHSFRFSLDFMAVIEKINTPEVLLVHEYQEANA